MFRSDVDRRGFLKSCYKIGGIAAIMGLGISAVEDAMGWGILPAVVGSGGSRWVSWNELSEEGLGDTSRNFVIFGENTSAGGDETGLGIVSGADLVFTQSGNIAGATGTPPHRPLVSASSQYFTFTNGLFDATLGGTNTWTLIMKIADIANGGTQLIFDCYGDPRVYLYKQATNEFSAHANAQHVGVTTDTVTNSGIVYFCMWSDGVYIRSGFKLLTKPTKWSDFDSGKRNSTKVNYSMPSWVNGTLFINNSAFLGDFTFYYLVMSRACLINNSA